MSNCTVTQTTNSGVTLRSADLSENKEKISEKSRECPICHVPYKYGNSYWQHVRYVHSSYMSQCVICEKSYKRTTMTKHHILHSHKIAWHMSSKYVRRIRKSELLKQEKKKAKETANETETKLPYFKKKTLHLIRCFNCYECTQSFPTIDQLFQHVKVHRINHHSKMDYND